jgi:hypothetical protein
MNARGHAMRETVPVFVSYSHKDAEYLRDSALLGFLRGLEKEGVEFWTDRAIRGVTSP